MTQPLLQRGSVTLYLQSSLLLSGYTSTVIWNDFPLFNFDFHFAEIEKEKASLLGCVTTRSLPESG